MKIKIQLILIFLFLGSICTYSQIINSKPKDTTVTVKYLLSSDWTFTFGNYNSFITVNQGQLAVEQRIIGAKILSKYRYGAVEGVTNYNEFYVNADLLFFPKNTVYGFANGGLEFSFLRGVNLRAWGSLGVGFKVLNQNDHKFEPTITLNYEHSDFESPVLYRGDSTTLIETIITSIGWTGSHKFFKDKLLIVHNYKWSQDLLFATNYKFDGGVTLAVPIIKKLMVKTSLIGSYQNIVPINKKQGDLIWTIGFAWGNF